MFKLMDLVIDRLDKLPKPNSFVMLLIVFLSVCTIVFIDFLTGGHLLKKDEPIDTGYFYYEQAGCVQRAQLIKDYEEFLAYSDWYQENNLLPNDGIRLAHRMLPLNPFKVTNVYSIDTLAHGVIYADIDQSFGRNGRYVRRGFVFYEYFLNQPMDTTQAFCDTYLNTDWSKIWGMSPDPREN